MDLPNLVLKFFDQQNIHRSSFYLIYGPIIIQKKKCFILTHITLKYVFMHNINRVKIKVSHCELRKCITVNTGFFFWKNFCCCCCCNKMRRFLFRSSECSSKKIIFHPNKENRKTKKKNVVGSPFILFGIWLSIFVIGVLV